MDPRKALLRERVRDARRSLDGQTRRRAADQLADVARGPGPLTQALARAAASPVPRVAPTVAPTVALYDPLPSEPDTRPLRTRLAAAGVRVLLPVVRGPLSPLGWREDDGTAAGPVEWLPAEALRDAVAVLVPALAVDRAGTRLGQGGGHYDVTLAAAGWAHQGARRPLLAAVVHDEEVLAAGQLPREAHDVGVEAALTPGGWVLLGP